MKQQIENIFHNSRKFLGKHSPEILTGLGIAGFITSTILAVKATPKALSLIDDQKLRLGEEELKPIETIKVAWKPYLPSILLTIASTSCIIGATSINRRRTAALAAAYTMSERALIHYRNKVIDVLGDKKEKEIQEKVAQDKVTNNNPKDQQIIITSKGNTLFMDSLSGRYFRSDIDTIKKIINDLNRRLVFEHYVSVNDLYYELGLKSTKNGSFMGWNLDEGLIEVEYNTALADNDEPCIVIDYDISPRYEFDKLM